jgi:hypothetical protein
MTHSVKDKCKHCDASISEELMLLHIRYAHPERFLEVNHKTQNHSSKNIKAKIRKPTKDTRKNKVKGYVNSDGSVECVLCHKMINYPALEGHMQSEHKVSWQQRVNYLRAPRAPNNNWVSFCQGGGPGLGKKH